MSLACPARLGASLRFLKNLPTPDNRSEARSSNKARRQLSKSVQALTYTYMHILVPSCSKSKHKLDYFKGTRRYGAWID
jgi:hypothetical protein